MWFEAWGAQSPVGPVLVTLGVVALAAGAVFHGLLGQPTILRGNSLRAADPPTFAERVSVHLLVYPIWAIAFGAVVWRGPTPGMLDVRLPFERTWPVIEAAEWVYLGVYVIPMTMPWLATRREALRIYSHRLLWLLALSLPCFWWLPVGAPPRGFEPVTLAGEILAWETGRPDFAAASLPSFHVFWGLLVASLLATRSRVASAWGSAWAVAVAISCLANGAHAIADVVASLVIYAAVAAVRARAELRPKARPIRIPITRPSAMPPSPK